MQFYSYFRELKSNENESFLEKNQLAIFKKKSFFTFLM